METITSRKNKLIAHLRLLGSDAGYRRQCGEFVCDGMKFLNEALTYGAEVVSILWCGGALLNVDCQNYMASRELLEYASPLKNTPGPVFAVKIPESQKISGTRVIVLDGVQDPGNVGTVIRTANAMSMAAVVLTGECADIYNPKTVRATMGAVFRQTVVELGAGELDAWIKEHGLKLWGAALSDKAKDIREIDTSSAAIAIGSEGRGLSRRILDICDGEVIIPMNPACESLNAAIAAAIAMWELNR